MLNMIMTVFHVIFFGFIVIAGFCNGSVENLVKPGGGGGLAPFGVKGVLDGAAIVYFGYIGYDSVSTMAEEIQHPSKTLPIGIVGSVVIVSALYCLMALSLCFMVPYDKVRTYVLVLVLLIIKIPHQINCKGTHARLFGTKLTHKPQNHFLHKNYRK